MEVSLLTRKQDKLHPTQLLVSILQPTTHERNPTSLYAEISELLVFRKRVNNSQVERLAGRHLRISAVPIHKALH